MSPGLNVPCKSSLLQKNNWPKVRSREFVSGQPLVNVQLPGTICRKVPAIPFYCQVTGIHIGHPWIAMSPGGDFTAGADQEGCARSCSVCWTKALTARPAHCGCSPLFPNPSHACSAGQEASPPSEMLCSMRFLSSMISLVPSHLTPELKWGSPFLLGYTSKHSYQISAVL